MNFRVSDIVVTVDPKYVPEYWYGTKEAYETSLEYELGGDNEEDM